MKLHATSIEDGLQLTIEANPAERKAILLGGILAMDSNVDPYEITKAKSGLLVVNLIKTSFSSSEELLQYLNGRIKHRPRPYRGT